MVRKNYKELAGIAMLISILCFVLVFSIVRAQTDGSTRLVSNNGQTDTTSGRLEIYYRGLWGAVCDDDFSLTEAQVACREMGYADVNSYGNVVDLGYNSASIFTPVWLDSVDCSSFDVAINNCDNDGIGRHDCSHREDVALDCAAQDFSGSSQFLTNVIIGVTVTIFIVFIVVPIIICIIVAVCVCGVCGSVGTSSGHHIHSRAVAPATTTSTFISTSSTGQQVAYPSAYPVTPPPPYYTIQPDPPKYN